MTSYPELALVQGMSFLAKAQATIAHNLANIDTGGFKRQVPVAQTAQREFQNLLGERMQTIEFQQHTDWTAGNPLQTGSNLDVTLGEGTAFRVQDKHGRTYYTRDGQLNVEQNGALINSAGMHYLDPNGNPIVVSREEMNPDDMSIMPNGQISNPATGLTIGSLGIYRMPTGDSVTSVGRGLYQDQLDRSPALVRDGLQQGYREASNVDSLQEMVQMIFVQRSFNATQKALGSLGRMQSQLLQNANR